MINVADISKTDKHVYVINNTKTDISITVKDSDGVSRLVRILRASIPQDAAEVVSPLVLKRTASFKRAIANDYLTLVEEQEAVRLLSTSQAKIELAAIRKKLSRIPKELMVTSEVTPLEAISGGTADSNIRSEVKDIAVDEEEPADDKYARLIALDKEEPLTSDEVTWLLSRIPTRTEYKELTGWLQNHA